MSYASNPNVIAQANQIADQMASQFAASQVMEQEVELNEGPSLLERIRESRLGRAMMMGGAVVAPAGAGFVGLADAPVAAANTTSPNGNLEAECAKSILAQPEILQARLRKPHQVHQSIFIKLHFGEVQPPECDSKYVRKAYVQPQLQDPTNHNKWINAEGSRLDYLYGVGNQDAVGGTIVLNSARKEKLYYKPGSGADVRFKLGIQERDKQTGKVLHSKVTNYPITVQ